ncbi:MAG TPA: phenylacetate--CoA ligase family protein, partial [Dokdonella sp.]|nr:phenylacetate--CoA ligase family protein [Dokdonella sp.]
PHLLKDVAGVRRFQVIQERLDLLVMLVVAGPEFGAEQEAGIRRELARVLGPSMELVIRRVDDIPLTPGGKLRVTISRLP